ncbi:hypothetical protein B566_EDAN002771 [Ephemera danica]|nr:hypothetical protein B566_EDAN002771 [Ephemera danica]
MRHCAPTLVWATLLPALSCSPLSLLSLSLSHTIVQCDTSDTLGTYYHQHSHDSEEGYIPLTTSRTYT